MLAIFRRRRNSHHWSRANFLVGILVDPWKVNDNWQILLTKDLYNGDDEVFGSDFLQKTEAGDEVEVMKLAKSKPAAGDKDSVVAAISLDSSTK